ncbi:family 16 glycoside hydrolase [Prosthecobacter sp.]|uniref:protein kinase domain-containing protein n=1 Tax=Prosthecobacter sp. TaxID=1965333 RepID=UPI002ABBCA6D|nr:family 16 glycoside hydrolase [Prosthecobacter sp.]MDZ4401393.1 family 16 glycoside hydrolase [Prosthecobacter sp.]
MSPDEQPTIPTARPNSSHPSSSGMWQAPEVEELQAMLPQYEIIEILGRGGMGAVYKARQKSLKRLVAIKILPLGAADDEMQFIERFQNEAQTMAAMNHPAIVSVYDFGETPDGLLYFIMEFVDGTDVQKMIRASGKLSGDYALAITAHVCDALHYAHSRGVIHRDIKPANILIDQEGHVKVADFGLAKMHDPSQTSGLTRTNMAMGTPDYIAPEVLSPGTVVDHRADIYAVGVMLYQMLTGEVPRGMFKLPSKKGIDSDPRFDAIIGKAMETDREERYQSAMDVRRALDVILTTPQSKDDGSGVVSVQELPSRPAKPVARGPGQPGTGSRSVAAQPAGAHAKVVRAKKPASPWLTIGGIVAVIAIAAVIMSGMRGKSPATKSVTAQAASQPPGQSSSAKGRTMDLLALVDVKRDALVGEWTRTASTVSVARPTGASVLQLPYQVPEEYDFEMEFTPDDAGANVNQYLSAAGHSFAWKLNAHSRTPPLYGLDLLDGKFCSQFDEAAVRTSTAIEPGRRYRSTVEVRRDGLRALLDGKELLKWTGDFKRLSMEAIMRLRDEQHLGIGSWNRAVTFHKIEVREVTGTGKIEGSATVAATEALFDGRTFTGWKTTNDSAPEASWRVEAGTLLSSTKSVLRTIEELGDCELDFEWRVGAGGNGGVFYHVVGDPLAAPEMQLCDPAFSGNTPSGGLFAVVQPLTDASKPLGEWNTARLVISGSHREHWINGQKVCAYDASDAGFLATLGASKFAGKPQFGTGVRGALALQNNGGEVAYRNLRIQRR